MQKVCVHVQLQQVQQREAALQLQVQASDNMCTAMYAHIQQLEGRMEAAASTQRKLQAEVAQFKKSAGSRHSNQPHSS